MRNSNHKVLLEDTNTVSLRTVYIQDGGDLVEVRLMPAWMESSVPTGRKAQDVSWALQDSVYLYRHPESEEEVRLPTGFSWMEEYVGVLVFDKGPHFKVVWTDSGNGLAVHLNGEPWAFIDEETHQGYSKGILKPKPPDQFVLGNPWNQGLFDRYFSL